MGCEQAVTGENNDTYNCPLSCFLFFCFCSFTGKLDACKGVRTFMFIARYLVEVCNCTRASFCYSKIT